MKSNKAHRLQTVLAYVVLVILSFLCLFFFYILIVNATRSHADLQKGFSALPGGYFLENLKSVANDGSFPMFDRFDLHGGSLYIFFIADRIWLVRV